MQTRLPDDLLHRLDEARGAMTRAAFIRHAVAFTLDEMVVDDEEGPE